MIITTAAAAAFGSVSLGSAMGSRGMSWDAARSHGGCPEMPRRVLWDRAPACDSPGGILRHPAISQVRSRVIPPDPTGSCKICREKPWDPVGNKRKIPQKPSLGAYGMPWDAVELP